MSLLSLFGTTPAKAGVQFRAGCLTPAFAAGVVN